MSIADKITRLTTARNSIRTALANKGVSASDHGFEDFATDIDSIIAGGGSAVTVEDTQDAYGGTIREITAVSLAGDTVAADKLLQGITAHNALGQAITGTYVPSGGGTSMAVQVNSDAASVRNNGYISTGLTLTVEKTGTYDISWVGWRSSSTGTMGSRLRINSTDQTAQQTFTNTYGQHPVMTDMSLTAGDVLTLYASSGSTNRYMWVANLIIEQTA